MGTGGGGSRGVHDRGRGVGGRVLSYARHPHTVLPRVHLQTHPVVCMSGSLHFLRPGGCMQERQQLEVDLYYAAILYCTVRQNESR